MTRERQEDTSWSDRNALHLDGGRSHTGVHTGQDSSSTCLNCMQIIPQCEKQQERGVTTQQGLDSAWHR